MFLDVDDAKKALDQALEAGDADAIDAARLAYLDADGAGAFAADVRYRLGLSRLFRHKDTDGAIELFKAAASEKGAPVAPEARVSLALCLAARGKRQQGIFELRKMLPEGTAPTVQTVQALDFLSVLLRDSGAAHKDIIAVDEQRKSHLSALKSIAKIPEEKAHFTVRLASAYVDSGAAPDLVFAKKLYNEVVAMGPSAGEASLSLAKAALKQLPR